MIQTNPHIRIFAITVDPYNVRKRLSSPDTIASQYERLLSHSQTIYLLKG